MKDLNVSNLTILYNSCDSYEDLWEPFFKLFVRYGNDLKKLPIVINTETKNWSFSGLNIKCLNLKSEETAWGARLRGCLERIDTEYVLFLLDDFFLQDKVDCSVISNCISYMESDKSVGGVNLLPLDGVTKPSQLKGFSIAEPGVPYRVNAQVCIWRKSVLYNSILSCESPWVWEIYGYIRNDVFMKSKILFLSWGEKEPFPYGFYQYGRVDENGRTMAHSAVMRGKWDMSLVKKLFKENDINIDYSIRGVYRKEWRRIIADCKLLNFLIVKPYRFLRRNRQIHNDTSKEYDEMIAIYVNPYLKDEKF